MDSNNVYAIKIQELLDELEYYSNIVVKLNNSREDKAKELQEVFKKNKNAQEVKDFAFDSFFVSSFQNLDLQIIRAKFVNYVELYLFNEEAEPLPQKVMDGYNYLKTKLPKRHFVARDGELLEVISGSMEEKKKSFEDKNLFELVERQVKEAMENVRENR